MGTKIQNSTNPAIAVDTVLGTGLSRSIMEATGRFEFIKGDDETMIFWDSGSGTTAHACILEDRNFIGAELDKTYFDKSIERLRLEQMQTKLF